jgi:PPK2 family polyphosphate:nucleotide phosphotransferase
MRGLIKPFRVTNGRRFQLKDFSPDDTGGIGSKDEAAKLLVRGVESLCEQQEKLYAQGTWAILLIFQAMDAAGKDSTIKHVMSGINPQGCQVSSFKAPSAEELAHDFLWRTTLRLPERGHIGVFNRSYYEEVLVVRVHPEILGAQRLPPAIVSKKIWQERFEDITGFERHLQRSGIAVLKFFLHVSKDEQKKRFLERLETPSKNWKFALGDVRERGLWREYMDAYEDMIRHTATPDAPWFVVPADHKWFARLVVSAAIVDAMKKLDLRFPTVDRAQKKTLKAAEAALRRKGA